ncbi:MAG: hypothetical protein FWE72_02260 [Spirochaetaceae bacterium]|nr:hypothetical protein [Spirochaetaceae bacterium]
MTATRPARPLVGLIIMIVLALLVYGWSFTEKPKVAIVSDYDTLLSDAADGDFIAKLSWMFGDWGDPAFQKTGLGGILMILGAILAYYLDKKKKTTFGICYGSGLFWRVLAAQLLAALISNFLYQGLFKTQDIAFVPTFIPIVSITPGLIFLFGGEWRKVVTAAVFGALIGCPFAYFIFKNFVQPWGLPGAVGWVSPMIIGGLLSAEACKFLPWMAKQASDPQDVKPAAAAAPAEPPKMNNSWFVKRVFADFSEANFYGSEIAGLFFILGGVIAVYLNPALPGYGDGNLYLVLLASQILASAFGVFIYWHRLFELGGYPTFVPVVTLGPIFVLFYGTALHVVFTGALIGAIFMPPFAHLISRSLPTHQPGYVGPVTSMFVCCLVFVGIFNQVPGFGV